MSKLSKIITVLVVIVVLCAAVHYLYQKNSQSGSDTTATATGADLPEHYTDNAHNVSIGYPSDARLITDKKEMASVGYIPTCNPDTGIACVVLPKELYPNSNFDGAGVSFNVLPDKTDEGSCIAAQQNENLTGVLSVGGIAFDAFKTGDAAMSHQSQGFDYRAFHNGSCFEITTRVNTTSYDVYPAGTIALFTDEEKKAVGVVLSKIVASLTFK